MKEVTAQDNVGSLEINTEYVYMSRGCSYEFAILDDRHAVVQAWSRDGSSIWEARVECQWQWRVVDLIRDARDSQR